MSVETIISSGIWPACSPDLNPWIYFWGLKDKVYNSNPLTKELKENINKEIGSIPAEQHSFKG
jgi:hypothetical protein